MMIEQKIYKKKTFICMQRKKRLESSLKKPFFWKMNQNWYVVFFQQKQALSNFVLTY